MRIVRLALVALALVIAVPTTAQARAPREGRNTVDFEGQERVYQLHLPPSYDGQTPLPLVVVLHGGGGSGKQMAAQTDFAAKADAEGFVVVFPTGQLASDGGHYWNTEGKRNDDPIKEELTGDDVGFLTALIDHLKNELAIESRRVYVAGFSNGASMAQTLTCALSDQIAAVASVSSGLSAACDPGSPVAVLQMMGTADPHLATEGTIGPDGEPWTWWAAIDVWSTFDGCPADPTVEVDGRVTTWTYAPCDAGTEVVRIDLEGVGHNWPGGPEGSDDPVEATDVVWDFFARHARVDAATPAAEEGGA
jgi:polyhydroxybutyrate depolymerase